MARCAALILAGAAALASPLPAQQANPSQSVTSLAGMPNTSVKHYEVTGATVTEVNRSIARQRPRSANGKTLPATTDWAVRAEFDRAETDGQCRVTAARASLTATVELPRLADDAKLDRQARKRWLDYVGELEQGALATIGFVYQNLGRIEQVMRASDCQAVKSVGTAAIERLRAQALVLDAARDKRMARQNLSLSEFDPAITRAKIVCRDLKATGTRINIVRICLPPREWDRMQAEAQEFIRDTQDQSINGRYF